MTQTAFRTLQWFEESIEQSLKLWHSSPSAGVPLQPLRIFQQLQRGNGHCLRQTSNHLLLNMFEARRSYNPEGVEILQLRSIEELPGHHIANRLNIAEVAVWQKRAEAIRQLAEYLHDQEQQLAAGHHAAMRNRLEAPSYHQLFGIAKWVDQLVERLSRPEPPWLTAIEGLGGTGKTSLAGALTRKLIDTDAWGGFAWITARQRVLNAFGASKTLNTPALTVDALVHSLLAQLLPDVAQTAGLSLEQRLALLRQLFLATPHLVVIDNLETESDITTLLDTLRALANPTRFLLTTHHRLLHEADIYYFALPALPEADALALLRHEATMHNVVDVAEAADADLRPIYAIVGGNPQALRLVVGQFHIYTLARVLDDLRHAPGQSIRNLYDFIYQQAWESLGEKEQTALLLMLIAPEDGASLNCLVDLGQTQLAEGSLRNAIDKLVHLNLVDVRGSLYEHRYSIHSLTRTFLHRQIVDWHTD